MWGRIHLLTRIPSSSSSWQAFPQEFGGGILVGILSLVMGVVFFCLEEDVLLIPPGRKEPPKSLWFQ